MKAIVVERFGGPENMKYAEVELPSVGPKQVLIRVKTTSVNFADIKARYGKKGQEPCPFIPGLEASGIVERVGDEVASFRAGQRVLAFPRNGSYAEYVVADENATFALPDRVSFDVAGACGIVSFLSYKLLAEVANIQEAETVLVHSASGGVGTTAIQVAKALGAKTVIGTVGNTAKSGTALEAGADHVLCYADGDFSQSVRSLTNGRGVDIALDSVGGDVTEQSMRCLALYGRLVVFGNSSGTYGRLDAGDLHSSCRSVLGYSFGTTRKERPETLKNTAQQVFRMLESEQLKIKISETFPLERAADAHRLVESRNSTGKMLLYPESK